MRLGQVVTSKAGRDKGKHFLVVGVTDKWVLIADGKSRRISDPKKKNAKHLIAHEYVAEGIGSKLAAGQKVYDRELRSVLELWQDEPSGQGGR